MSEHTPHPLDAIRGLLSGTTDANYRRLVEGARHLVYLMTVPEGRYLYVSPTARDVVGYSAEQLIENPMLFLTRAHPESRASLEAAWAEVLEGRVPPSLEFAIVDAENRTRWLRSSVVGIRDASGRLVAVEGVSRDVTEERSAKDAARRFELRYGSLIESLAEGVIVLDDANAVVTFNEAACRILRLDREDVKRGGFTKWFDARAEDGTLLAEYPSEEAVRTGTPRRDVTVALDRPDGSRQWLRVNAEPLFEGGAATPSSVIVSFHDVTGRVEMERALRESEARLREAQRIARLGNWEADLATGVVSWSEEMFRITGLDPATYTPVLGPFETTHPDDRALVDRAFADAMALRGPHALEHRIVRPDGRVRHVAIWGETVCDSRGEPVRVRGVAQDVTERVEMETALRDREAKLRESQRIAQLGSWEIDLATGAIQWSDETHRITGTDPAHDRPSMAYFSDRIHPDDRARVAAEFDAAIRERRPHRVTYRLQLPDGTLKHVEVQGETAYAADGTPLRIVGTVQDVTRRVEMESALRESEARLRESQRIARLGSWDYDLVTGAILWSEETHRISETDPESSIPRIDQFLERTHPDDRARVAEEFNAAIRERRPHRVTYRMQTPAGAVKHVEVQGETAYAADGAPRRVFGTVQDVTGRVEMELALRDREAEVREAQRVGRMGNWVQDVEHDRLEWSDELFRIFEIDPARPPTYDAFIGRVHPADREAVSRLFQVSLAKGGSYSTTYRLLLPDGRVKHVEEHAAATVQPDGRASRLYGTCQDVTERVRMEHDLREREAQLREAQRIGRTGSWEMDLADGAVRCSEEFYRIGEIEPSEATASHEGLLDFVHPDDRQLVADTIGRALADHQAFRVQYRIRVPGGRFKHIESRGELQVGPDGTPLRLRGVVQDVTERVETQRALEASLREKEILLREVHHRVKNNLQIVSSLLYFQEKKARTREDTEIFTDSRNRLLAMTLVHERLYNSANLSQIELGGYVRALLADLRGAVMSAPDRVDVRCAIDPIALSIEEAVPVGLLVCELITNSLKHAFPGTRPGVVQVDCRGDDERLALEVADDGVGLPADFDVAGSQTFGWQLVRGLVGQLGGRFEVSGEGGTRVRVEVPRRARR